MKRLPSILLVPALFSAISTSYSAPILFENGDFEAQGAAWTEVSGGGTFLFDYPATGGNPNGYGVIDHTADDGGFGIWVGNDDAEIPIASLGLTAGQTYVFTQDMRILEGNTVGGFKVDFFAGSEFSGTTRDLFPDVIGDGSTWETYAFVVTIPGGTDGIKVVPLWGMGSSVGYDNIGVETTPVETPKIPNGNFENGNLNWFEVGAPETIFSYPESGGNPDGHGVMTNTGGGIGNWVANGGAPLSLESLGLSGGDTVTFEQDMKIISGTSIGGLRIDFLEGPAFLGDTGNMIPELIGDGSTWETYSFEVPIPSAADNIKIAPIWGVGSSVGFDNVTFSRGTVLSAGLDFTTGTAVNWTPANEVNVYQPQRSDDGENWTNLGPAVDGDGGTSAFDLNEANFYRVLETEVFASDVVTNGGFETADFADPSRPQGWSAIGSQPPTRTETDFRTGSASLQIMVVNDDTNTANTSEIQQNIGENGGFITPGETYDFSFWAKQLTSGVSYVQQYRLQWLDGSGAIISEAFGFTPFAGGTDEWTEISQSDLVAPAGASTALIQIFGATGAVAGANAQGGVLIDDLSLVGSSAGPPVTDEIFNGDFEFLDFDDPDCAEGWICAGTQPPTNVISDSLSGIASMELRVQNDGSATPNSSAIQHDVFEQGGTIVPGSSYRFSFRAKQLSSGVSYVQQYRLEWRDAGNSPLPGGINPTNFAGGDGVWAEIAAPDLVAPAGAVSAFIEIVASTGAVAGGAAEGEVLIDDASLTESVMPNIIAANTSPGLQISWQTEAGVTYQPETSPDLREFEPFGAPIIGDGSRAAITDLLTLPQKFYQVDELTP